MSLRKENITRWVVETGAARFIGHHPDGVHEDEADAQQDTHRDGRSRSQVSVRWTS